GQRPGLYGRGHPPGTGQTPTALEGRPELVLPGGPEALRGRPAVGGPRDAHAGPGRYGGPTVGAAADRAAAHSALRVAHGKDLPRMGLAAGRVHPPPGPRNGDRRGPQVVSERSGGERARGSGDAEIGAEYPHFPIP